MKKHDKNEKCENDDALELFGLTPNASELPGDTCIVPMVHDFVSSFTTEGNPFEVDRLEYISPYPYIIDDLYTIKSRADELSEDTLKELNDKLNFTFAERSFNMFMNFNSSVTRSFIVQSIATNYITEDMYQEVAQEILYTILNSKILTEATVDISLLALSMARDDDGSKSTKITSDEVSKITLRVNNYIMLLYSIFCDVITKHTFGLQASVVSKSLDVAGVVTIIARDELLRNVIWLINSFRILMNLPALED